MMNVGWSMQLLLDVVNVLTLYFTVCGDGKFWRRGGVGWREGCVGWGEGSVGREEGGGVGGGGGRYAEENHTLGQRCWSAAGAISWLVPGDRGDSDWGADCSGISPEQDSQPWRSV